MSNSTKTIIIGLIFVLFMCVASYFVGRGKGREIGWNQGYSQGYADGFEAPHPGDTTAHIDTSHFEHPEPVDVQPTKPSDNGREKLLLGTIAELRAKLDSLAAVMPDTSHVEAPVPIETKTYEDSTYRAQVSGYHPSLDWIETFNKTTTITNYIDRVAAPSQELSIFAEAGYHSFGFDAKAGLQYEAKISGPLRGFVRAGYEYTAHGRGPFGDGGVKLFIFTK